MKKSLKVYLGILSCTLLGIGVYRWFKKTYKKELANLQEEEDRVSKELEKVGVSKKAIDSIITPEDEEKGVAFSKMLYAGLRKNHDIDIDVLDVNAALKGEGSILHIIESEYNHRKYLDFMFEIPNYVRKSYKAPNIGDYITAFRDAAKVLDEDIVKCQHPVTRLEGYINVYCDDPDLDPEKDEKKYEREQLNFRMDPDLYGYLADEKHDGLTKFYSNMQLSREDSNDDSFDTEYLTKIQEWICNKTGYKPDQVHVFGDGEEDGIIINLMFKVSFPIANMQENRGCGITIVQAINAVKWILANLEVTTRGNSSRSVQYQHVIVHGPDLNNNPDLSWYWEIYSNGNVVSTEI